MCYTLKYGRRESVCIFVSLVVFAFSVTYIESLIKPGYTHCSLLWTQRAVLWFYLYYCTGEVWGKRKQLSCFSAYVTQSFIYALYFLQYPLLMFSLCNKTLFREERVKQQETSCKTKLISLWVAAYQHVCLWSDFWSKTYLNLPYPWLVGSNPCCCEPVYPIPCVSAHSLTYPEPQHQAYQDSPQLSEGVFAVLF